MNGYQHLFPKLTSKNHRTTSPRTPNYNCIAWAAEDDGTWWQPDSEHLGYYWPAQAQSGAGVGCLIDAFASLGYKKCADGAHISGFQKIAILEDANRQWTHAARQLPTGKWTSKLGNIEDIEHDTADLVEGI